MVLHLAEHLDVPLRARNALLIAAGFAPTYHATDLDAPEMQTVRAAIERILEGHEPFPAILVDRRWELVAANNAAALLTDGVEAGPARTARATCCARACIPKGSDRAS